MGTREHPEKTAAKNLHLHLEVSEYHAIWLTNLPPYICVLMCILASLPRLECPSQLLYRRPCHVTRVAVRMYPALSFHSSYMRPCVTRCGSQACSDGSESSTIKMYIICHSASAWWNYGYVFTFSWSWWVFITFAFVFNTCKYIFYVFLRNIPTDLNSRKIPKYRQWKIRQKKDFYWQINSRKIPKYLNTK